MRKNKVNIIPTKDFDEAQKTALELNMPLFNKYRHIFIDVDTKDGVTLSVNFNGTPVTFALIPRDNSSPECIDIRVHHLYGDHKNVNDIDVPNQKAIMFKNGRSNPIDGDLLTVLIHKDHLENK